MNALMDALANVQINGAKIYYKLPFELPVFGQIKITEAEVNSWIVIVVVAILCKVLTHKLKVRPESKRQIIAEFIVEKANSFVKSNMGESFAAFGPFIAALMALSALSSLMSIFGLFSPTADVNIIAGWAIVVFCMITFYKLKGGLGGYLKGFTQPIAVLTPFNIISEIATPVSMMFRHFGNICSGSVIMTLVYTALLGLSHVVFGWLPGILGQFPFFQIGIPIVFSLYFDIFGGLLQAFIFAMLTMMYISSAAEDGEAARAAKLEKQQKKLQKKAQKAA